MASLVLGSIGSSLLGPIGGFIGSAVGSVIDQYLFAPSPADVEGPRIDDLKTIAADPGVPIPLVYGADRIAGIVAQTTDLIETKHKKKVGGKGGGKSQSQISYTYHVDITYLLCEGPILGIGRIWSDGKLLRGTRYQMELDTEVNFEQIGGIPYSTWYKNYIYDAKDLHWSINPDYNAGLISTQKYTWDQPSNTFNTITDSEAEDILATTKVVIYAFDEVNQKYLPIPLSHDYTGEIIKESDPQILQGAHTWDIPTFVVPYSYPDGLIRTTFYDLTSVIPEIQRGLFENVVLGSAKISYNVKSEYVANDGPFSDLGWGATSTMNISAGRVFANSSSLVGFEGSTGSDSKATMTPGRLDSIPPDDTPVSATIEHTIVLHKGYESVRLDMTTSRGLAFSNLVRINENSVGSLRVTWTYTEPSPNIRNWPDYYNFYDAINDWSPKAVLEFHTSEGVSLYRGYEDQIADPTMVDLSPTGDAPAYICKAVITFQRLELEQFGNRIPNLTFEVVQSDNARIANVLTDLMDRSGVDSKNYDLSKVPTTGQSSYVHGYSIGTVTSYRAAMEPMMEAFQLDAAEIGNELVFRRKHRTPDHIIDYNDLAAVTVGSGPITPIRLSFRDVIDMPRSLGLVYKDPEREYQVNTAVFNRQLGRSVQRSAIQIGAVLPANRMKGLVRDKMRDVWIERTAGAWSLPHKYIYISVSDIVRIQGGPTDYTFKVTQTTRRGDGILEMEGVIKDSELYVPASGETDNLSVDRGTYATQQVYGLSSVTKAYFLDLPPLLDVNQTNQYQSCGIFYAPNGSRNTWPGCTLYVDIFEEDDVIELNELSTHYVNSQTGQLIGGSNFLNNEVPLGGLDTLSVVYVFLDNLSDTLSSILPSQLFDGHNAAVIGSEVINFQKAELQPDGSYKLTNFLRARLDTEDHARNHISGERFVVLDTSDTYDIPLPIDNIGTTVDLFSITFGETANPNIHDPINGSLIKLATGNGRLAPFTGRRLQPFRPVQIAGIRDVDNNLTITWRRQDRYDRNVYDGRDITMTDLNAFEMDIFSIAPISEDLTLLRTISSNTIGEQSDNARSYIYTIADQLTDGISSTDKIIVRLYQMSESVGRGNVGQGTL